MVSADSKYTLRRVISHCKPRSRICPESVLLPTKRSRVTIITLHPGVKIDVLKTFGNTYY